MGITRRAFMKGGAMAVVGTTAIPSFLTRAAWGAVNTGASNKRLVVIFQRGAADGLNIVVPHAEPAYYAMRPSINIPRQQVIDLNGFFGLHPAMAPLKPLWDQRHLAVVHAAGSPDTTRSHFDAQDYMESGTPGVKDTSDGWLNRTLQSEPAVADSPFRAIALGTSLPRILSGKASAVAVSNVNGFGIAAGNPAAAPLGNTFEAMYAQSVDTVLHGTATETFEAVKMLKSADPQKYTPAPGANYPRGPFGNALRQTAQLIKSNLGVQIAFTDIGGWDSHVNEGAVEGQLANVLRDFAQSIAAFWVDLGPLAEETLIVTMSEFGRTARENGNRGTDHGHANVMFILGGPVRGGRVYGRWPGLDPSQLNEGRDLVLTTDFRRVLGEAVSRHLGNAHLNSVFPGFDNQPGKFLQYLG
ncbi:MAG TPA: DUF1501 domain-containing protein [Candidatus Limnocylindrales bacterium]|nr:DUF1501 domain-containing protein [Candidatus Limnocylindrales bacterium]HZM09546.1 DUF1501 domain-containing protein [Candidatus Limnocylindrales bacterium]